MKAISIIIPVYNTEKYLKQCINSAISQTIKDIEIICVNDGSTDSSLSILNELSQKDDRICVITQKNKGLSAARNTGFNKATGEYILFLDSDDWYSDNSAIEKLYNIAKEEKLEIVFFEAETFFEADLSEKEKLEQFYKERYKNVVNYGDAMSGQELYCKFKKHKNYRPNVCGQIYSKSFLERNKIVFFDGIIHEDELFTIQCLALAKKAKCVDLIAYGRRIRPGSIMTQSYNDLSNCLGYLNVYKQLIAFGEKNVDGFSDEFLNAYCNRLAEIKRACINKYYEVNQTLVSQEMAKLDNLDKLLLVNFKREYDVLKKERKQRKKIKESFEYRIGKKVTAIPRSIQRINKK